MAFFEVADVLGYKPSPAETREVNIRSLNQERARTKDPKVIAALDRELAEVTGSAPPAAASAPKGLSAQVDDVLLAPVSRGTPAASSQPPTPRRVIAAPERPAAALPPGGEIAAALRDDKSGAGLAETAGTVISGLGGSILGGLHGAYEFAKNLRAGASVDQATEAASGAVHKTTEALTYEPKTAAGKAGVALVGSGYNPLNWIPAGAKRIGEAAQDAGMGALDATIIETALNALPAALLPKGGKPSVRDQFEAKKAPQPSFGSVGASATAATPDAIRASVANATPELRAVIEKKIAKKEHINPEVVAAHVEADSLPVPVKLTEGQASGSPRLISEEMNNRGGKTGMVERLQEQNNALKENINLIRDEAAPDAFGVNHIQNGETIIKQYADTDAVIRQDISAKYKALEDANGGQFPLDGAAFVKAADAALAKKMKGRYVPAEIRADLEALRGGDKMTFEMFENMRTNLAADIRKAERSGDGNAAHAASIVRDALEELPMPAGAEHLKPLADAARQAARARFKLLEKDPAYKAAINDMEPDKFIQKYVIGGNKRQVASMVENLGADSVAHQTMKAGVINYLKRQAGIIDEAGNFNQHGYNKALDSIRPKLDVIFKPAEIRQLEALGNTARRTQFQPRGSYVNNSNTLVGALAEKAKGGAALLGDMAVPGAKLGTGMKGIMEKRAERKAMEKSLQTGAGISLKDMK